MRELAERMEWIERKKKLAPEHYVLGFEEHFRLALDEVFCPGLDEAAELSWFVALLQWRILLSLKYGSLLGFDDGFRLGFDEGFWLW
jgi:hypothetical protein